MYDTSTQSNSTWLKGRSGVRKSRMGVGQEEL